MEIRRLTLILVTEVELGHNYFTQLANQNMAKLGVEGSHSMSLLYFLY